MIRISQRWRTSFLYLLVLLGTGGPAAGQLVLMSPVGEYYDWSYRFDFDSVYQSQTGINGGGQFDALRFRAGGGIRGPISHTVRLYLDAAYAHTSYDFGQTDATACPDPAACFANTPWQGVHTFDIAPGASLILGENVRIQAFVPIRWNSEGHSTNGGVTAGLVTEVRFQLSERFTTSLGVGVQSELGEDASVFPVIAVDWRFTDGLRLLTRGDPYQGGDLALLFGRSQFFHTQLSAGYQRSRFRLSSGSPNANGVAEVTSIPVLAGIRLKLGSRAFVVLEGGIALRGRLELDDPRGALLRREDFDTAGLLRGAFRLSL